MHTIVHGSLVVIVFCDFAIETTWVVIIRAGKEHLEPVDDKALPGKLLKFGYDPRSQSEIGIFVETRKNERHYRWWFLADESGVFSVTRIV